MNTTPVSEKPITQKEPQPVPMVFSFTYDGPIQATDDRSCAMCNAVSMKKCPNAASQHGPNPDACSSCHAARIGYCHNHAGITKAIEMHHAEHDVDDEHQAAFDVLSEAVVNYVNKGVPDGNRMYVKMQAIQDLPDMPYAKMTVEVIVTK